MNSQLRQPTRKLSVNQLNQEIGRLIEVAIALSGLERKELAARIYCTPRQLGNYIAGRTSVKVATLIAIADATGQPLDAFRPRQLNRRVSDRPATLDKGMRNTTERPPVVGSVTL